MIRVLVVDDDFMVAKVHSGYVTRTAGFAVAGVAHTGADALRAVEDLRPDLVLLDIYLPDMDGVSVLRALRSGGGADTDVIVISAATDVDTVRAAMRGGVLHYLIKPFTYAALYDQLRHFAVLQARLRGAVGGRPVRCGPGVRRPAGLHAAEGPDRGDAAHRGGGAPVGIDRPAG